MVTVNNGPRKLIIITTSELIDAVSSIVHNEYTNEYYVDSKYCSLFRELGELPTLRSNIIVNGSEEEIKLCCKLAFNVTNIEGYVRELVSSGMLREAYESDYINNIYKVYCTILETNDRVARLLEITDNMSNNY